MRDLVLVPTYDERAEYLALCLEHIAAAKGDRDIEVRVYHDMRVGHLQPIESMKVCERAEVFLNIREPHRYPGNLYNVLEAYYEASITKARYVYLVEDDVLVSPDFFKWHEAIQKRGDYFCSVGWHCIRNPKVRKTADPRAYIESAVDFSSIGVCWKRQNITPLVAHATEDYYTDARNYLARHFPNSPIPVGRWVEQAGLIMRMLLAGKGNRVVAWPGSPRCGHIGVRGYHRKDGHKWGGPSLDKRILHLRQAVESGQITHIGPQVFDDINTPLPEQPWEPEALYLAQSF